MDLVCKQYLSDQAMLDPDFILTPATPGGENPQCAEIVQVQKNVATFTLIMSVIIGTLSAFTAPRLGALSDRIGRRPAFMTFLVLQSGNVAVLLLVPIGLTTTIVLSFFLGAFQGALASGMLPTFVTSYGEAKSR